PAMLRGGRAVRPRAPVVRGGVRPLRPVLPAVRRVRRRRAGRAGGGDLPQPLHASRAARLTTATRAPVRAPACGDARVVTAGAPGYRPSANLRCGSAPVVEDVQLGAVVPVLVRTVHRDALDLGAEA